VLAPPSNARLKAVRRLSRRTIRERDREFLAEGPQVIREALAAGASSRVLDLFVAESELDRHRQIVDDAVAAGIDVHLTPTRVLAQLSDTTTPQGLLARCRFEKWRLDAVMNPAMRMVAVLANVRDPGNAGTIVRTADAAGADAVVLSAESVDLYNPKCVRATTGSLFHLPVVVGSPIAVVVDAARVAGLRILAADGAGPVDLDDELDSGRLASPTAWFFGNEASGLPADLRDLADAVVRVPIHGRAESLNLAAAAAVCLYASARAQRRLP
jgi:TrmH family RNA methyltransferase